MVDCMKVGAKVIPEWLVPVLLRLHLTVLTFPEMFGASFENFILLLLLLFGKWRVLLCMWWSICIRHMCIPYMSRKTYWMTSVLIQMYKSRIPPCTESRPTVLQESDIFIQIHTRQRLMDVTELRCIHV